MKTIILAIISILPFIAQAQLADSNKRRLPVEGAVNFRDIGGYKTKDGKTVVWNKIFRSDDISKLTKEDIELVKSKNIAHIFDFRSLAEAAKAPDPIIPYATYMICPAGSDDLPDFKELVQYIKKGDFLDKFYLESVQHFRERYKPLFYELLVLPNDESVVYHCTGGRDRTGMATALILNLLGVPREKIYEDFVASNTYLAAKNFGYEQMAQMAGISVEQVKKSMALRPELLKSVFDKIEKDYGSMDNFYEKELGIGTEEKQILRSKFLK